MSFVEFVDKNSKNLRKLTEEEKFYFILNNFISTIIDRKLIIALFNVAAKFGNEGGAYNVRDENLLMSSIEGPRDYYNEGIDRFAEIFFRLIQNHCFTNGNKRTAVLMYLDSMLFANYYYIIYSLHIKKKISLEKTVFDEWWSIHVQKQIESDVIFHMQHNFQFLYDFSIKIASTEITSVEEKKKIIKEQVKKDFDFFKKYFDQFEKNLETYKK